MESIDNKALMKMKNFIGDIKVKNIEELLNSSESGIFVVAGWFMSVVEGVDMWYPRVAKSSSPRFRMKVKVNGGDEVLVLSLFDDDVELLAMETCPFLKSMGESCSTFPDEMECYYGDGMLFKVEKNGLEESGKNSNFKVISICNDVEVVNEFIDEYYPELENISTISHTTHLSSTHEIGSIDFEPKPNTKFDLFSIYPIKQLCPEPVVLGTNDTSLVVAYPLLHTIKCVDFA
ncbi:hypothetical protein P8452_51401 [Trifolium repens]|nr:hypothetical protein P8452_51401 [Trifolium repens]